MLRRIDADFALAAHDMVSGGSSKEAAARALGCCQRTVRRALAALALAGTPDRVVDHLPPAPRYVSKAERAARAAPAGPARLGQECAGFGEALKGERYLLACVA